MTTSLTLGQAHLLSSTRSSALHNTQYDNEFTRMKLRTEFDIQPAESFSLINDPRNSYKKLYTVNRLGNIWGGRPVLCRFHFTTPNL